MMQMPAASMRVNMARKMKKVVCTADVERVEMDTHVGSRSCMAQG
jgi:hypothetical protein